MALLPSVGDRVVDRNGEPVSAGKLSVFRNRTTELAPIFSDPDLDVDLDNPIDLDGGGDLPSGIYVAGGELFTMRWEYEDGAEVRTHNDVFGWEQISGLTFATLAAVKAATVPDGGSIYLKGFGRYFYDASSTVASNDITVILPDSGTGRFLIDEGLEPSVADYGAIGDGTTDDTAALTAAFAAGVGRLVDGKTYLTDSLAVQNALLITGKATIKARTESGAMGLIDISSNDVEINGVTIDMGNTADSLVADRNGVQIIGTTSTPIDGVTIRDVKIRNCGEAGIWARNVQNIVIENADVKRCGQYGMAMWSCSEARIYSAKIDDVFPGSGGVAPYLNAYGITFSNFSGEPVCSDFGVYNSLAKNIPSWEGFDTHFGVRGEFVNCSTANCHQGVVVQSVGGTASSDIKILGGHHHGYGTGYSAKGSTFDTGGAVVVNMGETGGLGARLIISDLTANSMGDGRGTGSAAVKVEACDNFQVRGIILYNIVGYGVLLNSTCTGGIIDGLVIDGVIEAPNSNKRGLTFNAGASSQVDNVTLRNLPSGTIPFSIPAPTTADLGIQMGPNIRVIGGEAFENTNFENLRPGSAFLGAAREAIAFNGSGGVAISSRYGYGASDTPVVRNGAGDYTLTFKNTFVLNPRVVVTGYSPMIEIAALSTTTVQIITRDTAGTATDDVGLNISVFGA